MEILGAKNPIVFSVKCPFLDNRVITLTTKTWQYYILPKHPEVRNCRTFIEQIFSKDRENILIYRKTRDHNQLAILKKCILLQRRYEYIKIGIRIKNASEAVVTTAHGQNNLPRIGVEEI